MAGMRPEPVRRPKTRSAPLVPIALSAAAGIVADRFWVHWETETWGWIALLAAGVALGLGWGQGRVWQGGATFALVLAFVAIGGGWHHQRWFDLAPDDLARGLDESDAPRPAWVRGVLCGTVEYRPSQPGRDPPGMEGTTRAELELIGIQNGQGWQRVSGRVLLSVSGDRSDLLAGDPVQAAGTLSAIRGPLNPGERDSRAYPRARGIRLRLGVGHPEGIWFDPDGSTDRWARWLGQVRTWSYRHLVEGLRPDVAPLAAAILLGRRSGVDPEVNDTFARTGTMHLLAISGLHLQALAGAFWFGCRVVGISRRGAFSLVGLGAIGYAVLVGMMPSVVRAAAMTATVCLAGLLDRRSRSANVLALAALFTLFLNPSYLFETGWQLSFLAVSSLIWLVPRVWSWGQQRIQGGEISIHGLSFLVVAPLDPLDALERRFEPPWKTIGRRYATAIVLSLVASTVVTLATMPLVAWRFHLVPPLGIVLNLPLIPMTMLALFSAAGTLLSAAIWEPLAIPWAWSCSELLSLMQGLVRWGEARSWGYAFVPSPPIWWVLGVYGLLALAGWASWSSGSVWFRRGTWAAVAGFGLIGPMGMLLPARPSTLEAEILAVDHGLAVVLQGTDGRTVLYDCGRLRDPSVGRRIIAPALWSRGVWHIDEVVLTHADSDHYNGLPDLLDRFSIGAVRLAPGFEGPENPGATIVLDAVRALGIPIEPIATGDWVALGPGATAEVLHPPDAWLLDAPDNDRSVVLDVAWSGQHLLLTGDLDGIGLVEVIAQPSRRFDVVLAPHHGGRTANPPWFYDWARSDLIVVSQASPRWGTRDALADLERPDLSILRTWQRGAIQLQWTEGGLVASGFRDRLVDRRTRQRFSMLDLFEPLLSLSPPPWWRWLATPLGIVAGMALCLALAVVEWGAWTVVVPRRRLGASGPLAEPWESIEIDASDGTTLRGWWRASDEATGRTAIVQHGFAEAGPALQSRGELLHQLGWNVLLPDARGFGRSGGDRASFGGREAKDLQSWLDALSNRVGPGFNPVLWGRSMGSAIALRTASNDERVAALILEAPYPDLADAVSAWLAQIRLPLAPTLAVPLLIRAALLAGVSLRRPRPIDLAPQFPRPVLILHGADDRIIPSEQVRRLASAFPAAPDVIEVAGAGHSDVFEVGGTTLTEPLAAFLANQGEHHEPGAMKVS